jgi:hypothetical protein
MGEQSQQKRRTTKNVTGVTGDAEPQPLLMHPSTTGKIGSESQTTGYAVDEGIMTEPQRPGSSVVRYDNQPVPYMQRVTGSQPTSAAIPPRRQGQGTRKLPRPTHTLEKPVPPPKKNVHWLLPLGVGMLAMLALWLIGSSVLAWGNQRLNDIRYGNPRTYQTDAVVGHGDSAAHPSHFIAVNLNRQAIVIEFKGGDPAKSVSYVAPVYIAGDGGNLAPVTVEFKDVNGDSKPDMVIHIHLPSQDQLSVFINDGNGFRPANANDKINLDSK